MICASIHSSHHSAHKYVYPFLSFSSAALIGAMRFSIMSPPTRSRPVPCPSGGATFHSGITLSPFIVISSTVPHGYSFFSNKSSIFVAQVSGVRKRSASMEYCLIFCASNSGVMTPPGQIVVILTPVRASLSVRDLTKPMMACLVAQYKGAVMMPDMPLREA
jgi:hypothetical protein